MTSSNAQFSLTAAHLENGLTEEDFSRYAGFHVPAITFASFPHWENLRNHSALTKEQHHQRAMAIYRELLPKRALQGAGGEFMGEDTEQLALLDVPSIHFKREITGDAGGKLGSYCIGNFFDAPVPVFQTGRMRAAIVIHNNFDESVQHAWALKLRLPVEAVTTFPNDKHVHLLDSLHEMAHLGQEQYETGKAISEYYEEAQADYFAHRIAFSSAINPDTIQADIQARYFSMLKDPPRYWFADALSSLYRGGRPLDFISTFDAVKELRVRLALYMLNDSDKDMPVEAIKTSILEGDDRPSGAPISGARLEKALCVSNIFEATVDYWLKETPCELFSNLKHISQDAGLLSAHAHRFARRITAAAEHFNPELTLATPCRNDGRRKVFAVDGLGQR